MAGAASSDIGLTQDRAGEPQAFALHRLFLWSTIAFLIQLIRDIFERARAHCRPVLSFEFFPTKSEEGERVLLGKTIPALRELHPDFCSVTYGAGGSTRERTLAIVDRIQREQQR